MFTCSRYLNVFKTRALRRMERINVLDSSVLENLTTSLKHDKVSLGMCVCMCVCDCVCVCVCVCLCVCVIV